MKKETFFIVFLALGIMLQGANLWADDDAIMDVDDNAASFVGSWGTSSVRILYYGDDYAFAAGSGGGATTASATFTTAQTADITGQYHVYVRWTAGNMRATSAVYRIRDNLGNSLGSCTKDQRFNGGAWQFCDNVTLTAGRRGVVVLGNENEPTNRFVCADAVRFVRQSWDDGNLVGVRKAGVEWNVRGTRNIADLSTSTSTRTNLISKSIVAPSGGTGYVIVQASGWAILSTADRQVNLCIDDSSGGSACDSYIAYLEVNTDEAASGNYENRKAFHLQEVYSISSGTTRTYYLKAARESGATGTIAWNDFVLIYVPN